MGTLNETKTIQSQVIELHLMAIETLRRLGVLEMPKRDMCEYLGMTVSKESYRLIAKIGLKQRDGNYIIQEE